MTRNSFSLLDRCWCVCVEVWVITAATVTPSPLLPSPSSSLLPSTHLQPLHPAARDGRYAVNASCCDMWVVCACLLVCIVACFVGFWGSVFWQKCPGERARVKPCGAREAACLRVFTCIRAISFHYKGYIRQKCTSGTVTMQKKRHKTQKKQTKKKNFRKPKKTKTRQNKKTKKQNKTKKTKKTIQS